MILISCGERQCLGFLKHSHGCVAPAILAPPSQDLAKFLIKCVPDSTVKDTPYLDSSLEKIAMWALCCHASQPCVDSITKRLRCLLVTPPSIPLAAIITWPSRWVSFLMFWICSMDAIPYISFLRICTIILTSLSIVSIDVISSAQ